MRAGKSYHCARCGLNGRPHAQLCESTCRHARDEHGNRPPVLREPSLEWIVEGPGSLGPRVLRPWIELAIVAKRGRRERQLQRYVQAAGPIVPIRAVRDGPARIGGTVRILEPVLDADGSPCAALMSFSRQEARDRGGRLVQTVQPERRCGRFTVHDGTGIAMVDDDFVALLDAEGRAPYFPKGGQLAIREGDSIEVIGDAERGGASTADAALSLRGAPSAIRFEGSSLRPIVLRLRSPT